MAVQFLKLPLPTRESLIRHVERGHETVSRQRLAEKLDSSIHEYRLRTATPGSPATAVVRPAGRQQLGDILIRHGIINEDQLALARTSQRRSGCTLVTALVSSEIVAEEDLVRCFERAFRLPVVDLATIHPTTEALGLVSHEMASRHSILPVGVADSSLTVAIADPANHDGLQQVKFSSGCNLRLTLAPARTLASTIDRVYAATMRVAS